MSGRCRREASAPLISLDSTDSRARIFTSAGIFVSRDLAIRPPLPTCAWSVTAGALPVSRDIRDCRSMGLVTISFEA